MKRLIVAALACLTAMPLWAQDIIQPSEDVAEAIFERHKAFAKVMSGNEPDAIRAFFNDDLRSRTTAPEWDDFIRTLGEKTGARGPTYVHDISWYERDTLVAAVDFSQPLANGRGAVCGTVVWTVPTLEQIEVSRVVQNIVDPTSLRAMPVEEAARTMMDWRCPIPMVEDLLGVSIKKK